MRSRSGHKEAETPAPEIKTNGAEPAVTVGVSGDEVELKIIKAEVDAIQADAATEALKRQIAALKRAEQFQRQPPAVAPEVERLAAENPREFLLQGWKSQGMSPQTEEFLRANPRLVDHPDLCAHASKEAALQGHQPETEDHRRATLQIFNGHYDRLNRAKEPTEMRENEEVELPPPQSVRGDDTPAHIVSAPVSRQVPSADGSRNLSHQISLTREERLFAASIGLSEENYAKQKLRLELAKQSGDIPR